MGGVSRRSSQRLRLETPINLGSDVNSALFDAAPELTRKRGKVGPLLYFARGPNNNALDIYVSELGADGTFGAPTPVAELNSTFSDARVSVRRVGLEIFCYSNVPGLGLNDLWTSMRGKVTDPWLPPLNVGGPVNTPFNEVHPELSRDRRTLYFVSGRPRPGSVTPPGNTDLWVTTRTELDGDDEPRGCEDEDEEEEEEEEEG